MITTLGKREDRLKIKMMLHETNMKQVTFVRKINEIIGAVNSLLIEFCDDLSEVDTQATYENCEKCGKKEKPGYGSYRVCTQCFSKQDLNRCTRHKKFKHPLICKCLDCGGNYLWEAANSEPKPTPTPSNGRPLRDYKKMDKK